MKNIQIINVFIIALSFLSPRISGQVKMVFRYDDYTLIPSNFSDSILYVFQKNSIPICLGLIPFDTADNLINQLNSEQINDLRSRIKRKEVEIAMHGFNHINHVGETFLTRLSYSEFATIEFDKQFEKLAEGKRVLDTLLNIKTNIFIPPFNTYDNNTLKALEKQHFEIISASTEGTSDGPKIKFIPATCASFSDLPGIINKYKNDEITIIFYFHSYSIKGSPSKYFSDFSKQLTINELDTLLAWSRNQGVNFYTFSDLAKTGNYDAALFRVNSYKYNFLKRILNKFKVYNYGVYRPTEYFYSYYGLIIGNIILHLFSFLFVYSFVYYSINILNFKLKYIFGFLGILFIPLITYLYYIRNDFSFGIIVIMIIVNICAFVLSLLRILAKKIYL